MAISSDPECKKIISLISTDDLIENKTIKLMRNDFYLHYPYNQQSLISFGSQNNGRLGNMKNNGDIIPIVVNMPNMNTI